MKFKLKKALAGVLCFAVIGTSMPLMEAGVNISNFSVASATSIVKTGSCGENVRYTLDSNGLLTISGTGDMTNHVYSFDSPFYYNSEIKSVIIENGVTNISNGIFYHCDNLTSVTISDSVTTIGEKAFAYCTGLTSITIPNSVTSIGDWAFGYCTSLTGIIISNSVTGIGKWTFAYCKSLTSITIPNSVTNIGDYAFFYCESLTSITIPDSVTSIGDCAFGYHIGLTDVYYTGTETEWNNISIGNKNSYLTDAMIHFNSQNSQTSENPTEPATTTPVETKILGDQNGDGKIDSKDAVIVLQSFAKSIVSNSNNYDEYADVNKDGRVDSKDAVVILKYFAASSVGNAGNIEDYA